MTTSLRRIERCLFVLAALSGAGGCGTTTEPSSTMTYDEERPSDPLSDPDTWTDDQLRLNRAFAELDAAGVLARQELGDGSWSAMRLMEDEIATARAQGRALEGCVLTWTEAVDQAREGEPLVIGFGAVDGGTPEARAVGAHVGRRVLDALRRHGLRASWSGDPADEIVVHGLRL